jgi:hypothetical protein
LNMLFTIRISSLGDSFRFSPIAIPNMPHKVLLSQLVLLILATFV